MMRYKVWITVLLCAILLGTLTLAAEAQEENAYDQGLSGVIDASDLLTEAAEAEINEALAKASRETGIPVCAFIFEYVGREVWGEDLLAAYGLDEDDDMILMIVTVKRTETFYNLYTYGDAYFKINEKEVNYLLDDDAVYYNLKDDDYTEGLCAYAELAAQAYNGRLGVSWVLILLVALVIGAVVGGLTVKSIAESYKRKNPSTSYPLDRFAKLELTHSNDRVLGRFVTHTIVSSGGRGGRGGGGGTGGGSGHRGGR